MNFEIAQGH